MEIYSSGVIRNKKENILQLGVPVISIKSDNRDFTYWEIEFKVLLYRLCGIFLNSIGN